MNFLLRRIKLPKKIKLKLFIILSSIIFIIGILFLEGIYINKNIQKNNTYQFNNQTYYEVTLNPNIYFPHKIESNNYYIANSIKSIDIYFNYYIKSKRKENTSYSYDITATLKSYADNGTKLIWTKDFNLKNGNTINQEELNIQETYHLDYQYYMNYVKSFQEYFNIKTENYLYVNLNMKINDKETSYVLLTIPMNENIIEITMKEDNIFSENNTQNITLNKIIAFDFIILIIILVIIKIVYKENEESILKKYQDMIIVIQNIPDLNSNNTIYLSNLKDLITIAAKKSKFEKNFFAKQI